MSTIEVNVKAKKAEFGPPLTAAEAVAAFKEGAYVAICTQDDFGYPSAIDCFRPVYEYTEEKTQKWLDKGHELRRSNTKKAAVFLHVLIKAAWVMDQPYYPSTIYASTVAAVNARVAELEAAGEVKKLPGVSVSYMWIGVENVFI